jgi:hypothetical protein
VWWHSFHFYLHFTGLSSFLLHYFNSSFKIILPFNTHIYVSGKAELYNHRNNYYIHLKANWFRDNISGIFELLSASVKALWPNFSRLYTGHSGKGVAILKRVTTVSSSISSITMLTSHSRYVTCASHTATLNNLHSIIIGGIRPRHFHTMRVTSKYKAKGEMCYTFNETWLLYYGIRYILGSQT